MNNFYKLFLRNSLIQNCNKIIAILCILVSFSVFAQVSTYTFSQSSGTYTPITGSLAAAATGNTTNDNLNNGVYEVNLPFNFNFNGVFYSSMNISTNGFITFGATAPTTGVTAPISSTSFTNYDGAISAFGRDLSSFSNINGKSGSISWETVGTAPNREIVIQWKNFRPNSSTSTTAVYSFSFQIRLHETSNIINIVYDAGSYLAGTTNINGNAQIGLRGTSVDDFNNRLNASNLEFINSTAGTSNSSSQNFHTVNATPGMPSAGLTYTWTPPSCWVPKNLSVLSWDSESANISWTASISSPPAYDIYYSTLNVAPTSSTTPSISNVAGTTTTLMSLSPATIYYLWIRANCGSGNTSVWTLQSVVFATTCQPPVVTSTNGATVCPGSTATLSATTADPSATLSWYDTQTGGNLVSTGTSYTTPPIASTTNYYVSSKTEANGLQTGRMTYSTNSIGGFGTTNFGLVFDALNTFTLDSVTIYPISSTGASGTVTIDVINSSGNIVHTKTVNVVGAPSSAPVAHVANLNFTILPGTNYKIRLGSFTGIESLLFEPNATANAHGYPFILENLVIINTATLAAAPANTPNNSLYYYFYDWKISSKCESARTMVTATVDSAACLATSEVDGKEDIKVYPNPFSEFINISKPELVKSIKVSDVSGKLVKTISQPESLVRLQELLQGVYILQLEMKDGSKQSIKIIKK